MIENKSINRKYRLKKRNPVYTKDKNAVVSIWAEL